MRNKIREVVQSRKKSIYNFINIGLIKVLNILSKIVVVGYLIRVLGDFNYGVLTWVDSIIQYFIIFINFGFDYYAAKYIIETDKDKDKRNEVISSIYYIKSLIFMFSGIIIFLLSFNEKMNPFKDLIFLMLFFAVGEILNPIWYFQGVEKMHKITITTTIGKLLLLIATYFFITNNQDTKLYIILLVSINSISGLIGFYLMQKDSNFKFVKVSKYNLKNYFKESYLFFLGRISMFAFNLGTVFLIGYCFDKELVSIYDISIKIIFVFIIPYEVLQQALFPIIIKGISKNAIKIIILTTAITSLFLSILLYLFSSQLLQLFSGDELLKNIYVLKTMIALVTPVSLSIILANTIMVAKGFYKEFNYSLIISSIFFIFSLVLLYFTNNWSFFNVLLARIFVDVFLIINRLYICKKNKIF